MSMVDAHKAKIIHAHATKGRHHLAIETLTGDRFAVRRPSISIASELQMRKQVKALLEAEQSY